MPVASPCKSAVLAVLLVSLTSSALANYPLSYPELDSVCLDFTPLAVLFLDLQE